MKIVTIIGLLILAAEQPLITITAAPDRTPDRSKVKIPDISGKTNWGMLTQSGVGGKKIIIEGHEHWHASGEIRKDGSIYLLWILNENGRAAPSVYQMKTNQANNQIDLIGEWGWTEDIMVEEDGSLSGTLYPDTIYNAKDQD